MWALLSPRLLIAIAIAAALATSHFAAYRSGRAAVRVLWDADVSKRTAEALVAEQAARKVEQELNAKNDTLRGKYAAQVNATATVARAAADGMRNLETILAVKPDSGASATSGDYDPRDGIIAGCAGALVRVDAIARRLQDKTGALQDYAAGVCVNPLTPSGKP